MKRKEKYYTDEQKEIMKFGKILLGLIVVIGLLYLFTVYVVNKEEKYKRTNNPGVVQYENILMGSILNRVDSEYYVLVYDSTDISNSVVTNSISEYKTKNNHLPVYLVDLSNEMNKSFKASESSFKNDSLEDFKVKGTTLIKIKDNKISKFIETRDEILNELN